MLGRAWLPGSVPGSYLRPYRLLRQLLLETLDNEHAVIYSPLCVREERRGAMKATKLSSLEEERTEASFKDPG